MTTPQSDTPRTDAAELNFGEMPGLMKQMERELNAALARVRELEQINRQLSTIVDDAHAELAAVQPPAPTHYDRPNKPGWWWKWEPLGTPPRWVPVHVHPGWLCNPGKWTPATPPPTQKTLKTP